MAAGPKIPDIVFSRVAVAGEATSPLWTVLYHPVPSTGAENEVRGG